MDPPWETADQPRFARRPGSNRFWIGESAAGQAQHTQWQEPMNEVKKMRVWHASVSAGWERGSARGTSRRPNGLWPATAAGAGRAWPPHGSPGSKATSRSGWVGSRRHARFPMPGSPGQVDELASPVTSVVLATGTGAAGSRLGPARLGEVGSAAGRALGERPARRRVVDLRRRAAGT